MTESPWSRTPEHLAQAEELRLAARAARGRGEFGAAADLLQRAITLDPQSSSYSWLGECLLALGRVPEGILHLAAGVGLGHNQFKDRVLLAEALYGLGSSFHHAALWQLEEALRIDPRYRKARELLAEWLRQDPGLTMHLHQRTADLLGLPSSDVAPDAGSGLGSGRGSDGA